MLFFRLAKQALLVVVVVALFLVGTGVGWFLTKSDSQGLISVSFAENQVWKPSQNAKTAMLACAKSSLEWHACVTKVMTDEDASKTAIDFFSLTDAILTQIEGSNRIKVGLVYYPDRSVEAQQFVLLGGNPHVFYVERPKVVATNELESDVDYYYLKQTSPGIVLWPQGPELEASRLASDGGQKFIFRYKLLEGCYTCPQLGWARVQFETSPDGSFSRAEAPGRLLGVIAK